MTPSLQTYITIALGVFVALVGLQQFLLARQQFSLAKEKFKLDLFEKRFAVYKATQAFLRRIMQNPNIEWDDSIDFLRATQDAVFLFESETVEYLNSLYKKSVNMNGLQHSYAPLPVGPERSALWESETKLVKELTNERPKLKDVFGRYLKFKVWK